MNDTRKCPWCHGTGAISVEPGSTTKYACPDCGGTGRQSIPFPEEQEEPEARAEEETASTNPAPEPSEADKRLYLEIRALYASPYFNKKGVELVTRFRATQHAALLAERDELRRELEIRTRQRDYWQAERKAERTLREANEKLVGKLKAALWEIQTDFSKRGQSIANHSDGEFTCDYTTRSERVFRALGLTPADFLPPATLGGDEKMKRDGPSELVAKLTEAPKGPTPAAPQPPADFLPASTPTLGGDETMRPTFGDPPQHLKDPAKGPIPAPGQSPASASKEEKP